MLTTSASTYRTEESSTAWLNPSREPLPNRSSGHRRLQPVNQFL